MSEAVDVLATLLVVVAVGPFLGLYAWFCWQADDMVGLRADYRRGRAWLREWWVSEPDDAPLWAEVLGLVVPFGFLVRAASHAFAAQLQGIDASLATRDVTAANAVAAVQGRADWLADVNGRVTALVAGCVLWWSYGPGTGAVLAVDSTHALAPVVEAYVVLNIGVLFADPLLFAVYRLTTNIQTDTYGISTR